MKHLKLYENFLDEDVDVYRNEDNEIESGPSPDLTSRFRGIIKDPKAALDYMFAGKSIFTIANPATHTRFTYRVFKKEVDNKTRTLYFVSILSGPDNVKNYSFIGTIFDGNHFRLSAKSKINADSPSVLAFEWLFRTLIGRPDRFNKVEFWHEEYCGRCGRRLTVPTSIESGYGPECIKIIARGR